MYATNHHVVAMEMGMVVEEDEVAVVRAVPVVEVAGVREGVVVVVAKAVVEIAGFTTVKGDVVALGEAAAAPPPHKDNGTVAVSASQASG